MRNYAKTLSVLFFLFTIVGCGSGGDTDVQDTIAPVPDTESPVITLVGDEVINLLVGETYVEQGVTISDNVDTNLSAVTTGEVDTNTAGSCIITYTATDAANNQSSTTRTIIVEEAPAPSTNAFIFDSENEDSFYIEYKAVL
ncbi:MAG: hypothetical protein ACI9IT_000981 [Glaciecola sp.]|jgi:hypothetical protein